MKLWLMENINFVYTVDRMINRLWPQLEDFYLNSSFYSLYLTLNVEAKPY